MAGVNAPPGYLRSLAAVAELFGWLALRLGLMTPMAALGVGWVKQAAIGMAHLSACDPFVSAAGQLSYELAGRLGAPRE